MIPPRCIHCDRPMRSKRRKPATAPGTVSHGGHGYCSTCHTRLARHGTLDGWMPCQPGHKVAGGAGGAGSYRRGTAPATAGFVAGARPWLDSALCAQVDPDVFFADRGGSTREAKKICSRCPVRTECLQDALDRGDVDYGIIGGLTPRERRRLKRGAA